MMLKSVVNLVNQVNLPLHWPSQEVNKVYLVFVVNS